MSTVTHGKRTPQLRLVPRYPWLNDEHNLQVLISYTTKGAMGEQAWALRDLGSDSGSKQPFALHGIHVQHLPLVQRLDTAFCPEPRAQ